MIIAHNSLVRQEAAQGEVEEEVEDWINSEVITSLFQCVKKEKNDLISYMRHI